VADAATVMGDTGIIYVCAECRMPVESEPCKEHQPAQYLSGFLAWAKPGARCKVPGFEDWKATPFNGWVQDESGWMVTHGLLAEMMVDSGFRYDFEADTAAAPSRVAPTGEPDL
jgi:hypothetical protein